MSQVAHIDRTTSNISTLVHENYVNEVKPWVDHISPVAALFQSIGDGGYTLVGEKLQFAAEYTYAGMFLGTDGYLPDSQAVDPVELNTTPARLYRRQAVDNFLAALAIKPGAYDDFMARLMEQVWDAVERGTTRHVHGGTAATVCKIASRTSATVVVVDDYLGYTGALGPTQFLEPGMWLTALDASNSFATLGAAVIDSIDHDTSASTATITFATDIDDGATVVADGDLLVFSTSATTSDAHFVTERNRAPNGLLDIIDPGASNSSFMGAAEATYARWKPLRRASADFGQVELMRFLAEIGARSQSPVTPDKMVLTMSPAAKIELAEELLAYQQANQLGRELQGGWTAVRIGPFEIVEDNFHLDDVVYAICPEDLYVVDLDGDPAVWAGDGSEFSRLADYDGKEWFVRHYVQRFAGRRNRLGALTGVAVSNAQRYTALPEAA